MTEEHFPNLDEAEAEQHIAAITGETDSIFPVAERPSLPRRGATVAANIGKVVFSGQMAKMMAEALKHPF